MRIEQSSVANRFNQLTIPEDIANRYDIIVTESSIRENDNALLLGEKIRHILDPENAISDLIIEKLERNGYLIVSGLPLEKTRQATPTQKLSTNHLESLNTEKTLIYLSALLGSPQGYNAENDGNFIHDLYPIKGNENSASGTGSSVDLELHNEIAFDLNKPDYLILTTVRSREEQQVPTTLVNIEAALSSLTAKETELLYQKQYLIRAPYSFSGGDDIYYLRSLVSQDKSKSYCLNFNHGVTHCLQPEGKALFEKIHQLLNQNTFDVLLEEGSALIIDNNKMLHGRNLFKPKFDGKDRWLQRVYVKKGDRKNG